MGTRFPARIYANRHIERKIPRHTRHCLNRYCRQNNPGRHHPANAFAKSTDIHFQLRPPQLKSGSQKELQEEGEDKNDSGIDRPPPRAKRNHLLPE